MNGSSHVTSISSALTQPAKSSPRMRSGAAADTVRGMPSGWSTTSVPLMRIILD